MTLKFLCVLGMLLMTALVSAQQRWLVAADRNLQTDGMFTEYPAAQSRERTDHDCARA